MPSLILNANGMVRIVTNAGAVFSKSFKSSSARPCIMKAPTITRAGAVASAGMIRISGVRNSASRKQIAVAITVNPVRPPASTPAALSM
jgi:hypothetical protein